MNIYLGTDHAGFNVKDTVKQILQSYDCNIIDLAPISSERVDYPDYAHKVAKALQKDENGLGILICGTGIGISISANKHKGIRAALCHDAYTAEMARAHNNANILAFGERVVGFGVIESMIDAFLKTPFEQGRHTNRVKKIEELLMLTEWLITTFLVSLSIYLVVMVFYYRILLKKEKSGGRAIKTTLSDAEILIRKYQVQLQRALGNIDILSEELNKVKSDTKSLRARNSQYRLENDKLRTRIKELEGKIEALL